MKGLVDHLIASEEELERELEQEYEGRKFPYMEHATLLAIQLSGKLTDEDIIDLYKMNMLKEWQRKFLKKDLIMHARYCLRQQQKVGFKTVSFLDVLTYPEVYKKEGNKRPVLLHYMGDLGLCDYNDKLCLGEAMERLAKDEFNGEWSDSVLVVGRWHRLSKSQKKAVSKWMEKGGQVIYFTCGWHDLDFITDVRSHGGLVLSRTPLYKESFLEIDKMMDITQSIKFDELLELL